MYTKKRGERPDLSDPVCMRKGATIEVCAITLILSQTKRDAKLFVFYMTIRRTSVWEFTNPSPPISDTDLFGGFPSIILLTLLNVITGYAQSDVLPFG